MYTAYVDCLLRLEFSQPLKPAAVSDLDVASAVQCALRVRRQRILLLALVSARKTVAELERDQKQEDMKMVAGFYKTCQDACRFREEQNRVFVLSHPEPYLLELRCRSGHGGSLPSRLHLRRLQVRQC